jgi:hypothetical protein
MAQQSRSETKILGTLVLIAGLTLATWPAWRVLLLDDKLTFEELVQLVCTTPAPR